MNDMPTIEELNELPADAFSEAIAPLFEGAPRFLARLAVARPFGSEEEMLEQAREIARGMPDEEQVELLDAHPRIGEDPERVSAHSHREQGYDDEAALYAEEQLARTYQELVMLNELYEGAFGFRFVVFVAGRTKDEIVPLMERALHAERSEELRRGLDDTIDIAADRLRVLRGVGDDEEASVQQEDEP